MHYRTLGRTGFSVNEIGLGAWGLGGTWGVRDDAEAERALRRAFELGVNFVGTALVYGNGHSEGLIARFLKGRQWINEYPPPAPPSSTAALRHLSRAFACGRLVSVPPELRRARVVVVPGCQDAPPAFCWLFGGRLSSIPRRSLWPVCTKATVKQ